MVLYTILYMDSGLQYNVEMHPDDVMKKLVNSHGVVINGFVQIDAICINPSHVSSISTYRKED